MGIEVELTKIIRADAEIVWDYLSRPETWSSWWPDCTIARTLDDRALQEGSRLEIELQPVRARLTLRPEVDLLTEGRTLSLTHHSTFIHSTVAWYLQEKSDATHVKAELVFNGVFPFLVTISQNSGVVRSSVKRHLMGLKKAAERMV